MLKCGGVQIEKSDLHSSGICVCTNCKEYYEWSITNTEWREYNGYSVKVAICPLCGKYTTIKIVEDIGLDVNKDIRFYIYKQK